MARDIDRQEQAIRFVLGDLFEDEEIRVGKRYLTEQAHVEELELAEDEIVDRYVRGELSAENVRRFDQILRNSARLKERVEFARVLAKKVSLEAGVSTESGLHIIAEPTPVLKPRKKNSSRWLALEGLWGTVTGTSPTLRFALLASVVLMLISSLGVVVLWSRLQANSERLAAEQQGRQQIEKEIQGEKARNDALQAELDQARRENEQHRLALAERELQLQEQTAQQVQSRSFPAIFLSPWSGRRGSGDPGEPNLEIHRGAVAIGVNLNVQNGDYPSYNASITDANDRIISQQTRLEPIRRRGRQYIRLQVARNALADGLYKVHVDGVTTSGQVNTFADYVFRVRMR